ncbi:MAG: proton-conducting transporter membrane subunit [Nitrospiraceae bacterium]|nr:proton-conducting transporter membrane subunit [Nitrospiraceae bacterium]
MLLLVLIPLAAALACLFLKGRGALEGVTIVAQGVFALWAALLAFEASNGAVYFGGDASAPLFYADALSAYILCVIAVLSFASGVYSVEYIRSEVARGALPAATAKYYYVFLNLFVFTMAVVPVCGNLALLWIAIEATTLVSALLVGIYRRAGSVEAAWKYIVLCTVGITFALMGTFILYYASSEAGSGSFEWSTLRQMAAGLNPATMRLAFLFVMIGYGTKAGLAPVHNWLPDAHSEAPTPVSALLSGVLLNCAFYGVIRVASIARVSCGPAFVQTVMISFGIISIMVAAVFMHVQRNAKRLLAYSSIEHMGIISTSFGAGGQFGVYAALLHVLNHAIAKPLMFFVTGRTYCRYHSVERGKVKGLIKALPLTAGLGFAGIFALAGAPPSGTFISEFLMLRALADGRHWAVLALFLIGGTIVFYALIRNFGSMFLGKEAELKPEPSNFKFTPWKPAGIVMLSFAVIILALGLHVPGRLDSLIRLSAGIVGQ